MEVRALTVEVIFCDASMSHPPAILPIFTDILLIFTAEAVALAALSDKKFETDLLSVDISIVEVDEDFEPQSPIPKIQTIIINSTEKNINE
jgi:hypothetical protein